jgi:hypothetical protein
MMTQKPGNHWAWSADKLLYYKPLHSAVERYYKEYRTAPMLQWLQRECQIQDARAVRRTLDALTVEGVLVETPDRKYIPAWALHKF